VRLLRHELILNNEYNKLKATSNQTKNSSNNDTNMSILKINATEYSTAHFVQTGSHNMKLRKKTASITKNGSNNVLSGIRTWALLIASRHLTTKPN
jgi:hypothetical protein